MTLMCDATVTIDSERVVPRIGRSAWLNRHGIPPETMQFAARAPASAWEAAGCYLTVSGQIKRMSVEAVDALCVPVRVLVSEHYPESRIPDDKVLSALQMATSTKNQALASKRSQAQSENKAKMEALAWVEANPNLLRAYQIREHEDPRHAALEYVAEYLTDQIGNEPIVAVDLPRDFPPRTRPSKLAIEVRHSVEELIHLMVRDLEIPIFVKVTVMEISRIKLQGFATVVPVKIEVPGIPAIMRAWSAENRLDL